jgi:hypothetical protein
MRLSSSHGIYAQNTQPFPRKSQPLAMAMPSETRIYYDAFLDPGKVLSSYSAHPYFVLQVSIQS